MKIQHWAIIFIIIILPFSIICRNAISKKTLLLKDETRYNNVIDNATYDAVSQILEVSEELGYGKNIPMTKGVADAAIDRFFNTLSVNFNMPIGREKAESYFSQYIPAIIIVGYDGLYVYSYEPTTAGYDFVLKPKIPYAYKYNDDVTINFTLDNYVKMYFKNDSFLAGVPDETGEIDANGTHILEGYIGNPLDVEGENPYQIPTESKAEQLKYIKDTLPMFTDNLSYILKVWAANGSAVSPNTATNLNMFYDENAKQDYEYEDDGTIKTFASDFNIIRRETIINLITATLKEEFNEHNTYTDYMGITYEFNIPDIGRDQWNNTIDDISVLAFMQGMPMGADMYYNNYSLGGARIVKANYLYGVKINNGVKTYNVYHKYYCPLIPKVSGTDEISYDTSYTPLADGSGYQTTGVDNIFINADHAKDAGYYICSQCM